MDAEELRAALAEYAATLDVPHFFDFEDMKVEAVHCLADAARLIALPVLEEPHARKHLEWIADRLVNVYGESENVDFVRKLRKIAALIPIDPYLWESGT